MSKKTPQPEKAYKNLEFLNSPDARTIRILAEFLEPKQRFHLEKIFGTIVFFGSARARTMEEAKKSLAAAEERLAGVSGEPEPALREELEAARNRVFLSRYYEDAVELARRLTQWSKTLEPEDRPVICSGGGPGMMEAANRGAIEAGGRSIGLNISLPFEQFANPYITPGLNFEFHYFFMRKLWLVHLARALVVFPGGFGTLDELFEVLTLVQTGKVRKKMPIVIYGSEYWNQVVNMENMARYGVISKADLDLARSCDTVDEAFSYLKEQLADTP